MQMTRRGDVWNFAPERVLTYGIEQPAFSQPNIEDRGRTSATLIMSVWGVRLIWHPGRHVITNALASLAAASVWGIGIRKPK
jgi:UDP-N-acetylmuramate-alanine ligase